MTTVYDSGVWNNELWIFATIYDENGNIYHCWVAHIIKCQE